jgi:hypothetical protein
MEISYEASCSHTGSTIYICSYTETTDDIIYLTSMSIRNDFVVMTLMKPKAHRERRVDDNDMV